MKIFGLDWTDVLRALPSWESLSPRTRLAFLEVKPGQGIAAPLMGAAGEELLAAGLLEPAGARGTLLAAAPAFRPLLVALRAMGRVPVPEGPGGTLPVEYLQEHFTQEEMGRITGTVLLSYSWMNRGAICQLASSEEWMEEFLALDAEAARRWEQPRLLQGEAPRFSRSGVSEALRELVRALVPRAGGAPLRSLADLLPGVDDDVQVAALEAGIRYLLVFPTLREGPEAVLTILPAVAERFGPPPAPPGPVEPAETFEAAFRLADMTEVLVEAATEPIPVRGSDGALYVRARKLLAARLQRLPGWVEEALDMKHPGEWDEDDVDPGAEARLTLARGVLALLKLVEVRLAEGRYQLAVTRAGQRWLGLPEGDRLREVLEALRRSGQRNPGGWYGGSAEMDFFAVRLGFPLPEKELDLRAALSEAFLSVPEGAMVPLDAFLRYHGRVANPFLAPEAKKLRRPAVFHSGRPGTREQWEDLWGTVLGHFLALRLAAFGGARLGRTSEGHVCFGPTGPGRFLLGRAEDFEYALPAEGEVVVQPDFEVVFLAPAPRVEAEVARFAERTGTGVGALFRITRASVMRAAERGMPTDAVLETLSRVSRTGVPANVARQVRDWVDGTRRVRIRPAVLVECPDAETAGRVRALAGNSAEEVTPTLLRLDVPDKDRKALVKRLRERGIFVEE